MPFSRIIGQETCIDVLRRSLRTGKMAHAYIFEGIEGCGKKTTALAFIEAAFCGGDNGCGQCPSCRKIATFHHPDLHIVEPDGTFIKIDQIRELQRELSLRPVEVPMKACIIDDADRLNPAAANALLKTLEEPPGNALIILLTSRISGVLPTVLSRCQRLRFPALSQRTIEEYLVLEGKDPGAAGIAASLAGGSLGRALDMGNDAGTTDRTALLERLGALSLRDITPLFTVSEEMSADREQALESLEMLAALLRDVLVLQGGGDSIVNRDIQPLLEAESARFSAEKTLTRIGHVMEARQSLMRNANPRLTLDVLLMRLAS